MIIEETKIVIIILCIPIAAIVAFAIAMIILYIKKKKEENVIREIADPFENTKTEMFSVERSVYNYDRGTTVQLFNEVRKAKLTLTDVNMPARRYTAYMNKRIIIGRSAAKADICIDYDPFISSTHCAIEMRNGRIYLMDLKSSNKTYVNNNLVISEVEISSGCIIKMGRVSMHVEVSIV